MCQIENDRSKTIGLSWAKTSVSHAKPVGPFPLSSIVSLINIPRWQLEQTREWGQKKRLKKFMLCPIEIVDKAPFYSWYYMKFLKGVTSYGLY